MKLTNKINRVLPIVTLFMLSLSYSVDAQDDMLSVKSLFGQVLENDSITPVPFAFVAHGTTGLGKATDENGMFRLDVVVNDTIFFHCLGYQDTTLIVSEDMLEDTTVFYVNNKSYQIESVDVLMFRSYASFRHMVANMDMMDDDSYSMPISINQREIRKAIKEQAGTFGVGITFGSGPYTRKEKKYRKFEANELLYRRFRKMTSRENMRYLTKLENTQLDAFMVFLRSKHNIDPELSDYKMMEAINLVFEEFIACHSDSLK